MARRRKWSIGGEPPPRSAIGDKHVDAATSLLTRLCHRSVAATTKRPFSINQIVHMMFEPDTIRRATEARGVVDDSFLKMESYTLYEARYGRSSTLNLTYENEPMLAIWEAAYKYSPRHEPLLLFIDEVYAVYRRFEAVKGLLGWLNRNATAGAIRYYFPAALQLTPDAPCWNGLEEVPSRYHEPAGIGDWIQTIKDATNTMAAASMLPADSKPNPAAGVSLTFGATRIDISERASYITASLTFNV